MDKHKTCDDAPYGGGPGMLMLAEPLSRALESAGAANKHVIYLTPSGWPFTQKRAQELAAMEELVLVCGRYEGIDQRIIDGYVDEELSVGDYVLSSGEAAALAVIDTVYRLVDQVIAPESLEEESFSGGLLEYPQYTRPEVFDTIKVPEVLLSGHHENIRRWRLKKRVEKTLAFRPDLLEQGLRKGLFDAETVKLIQEGMREHERDKSD
jgi:tRNA (guanine37-N1)-methyltransferase